MTKRKEPVYETSLIIGGECACVLHFNDKGFDNAEAVFREDCDVAEAMDASDDVSIRFQHVGEELWDE